MALDTSSGSLTARLEGRARTGEVCIEDFDRGLAFTLGAIEPEEGFLYLAIPGVPPPPGPHGPMPGIPITFANPEAPSTQKVLPMIEIAREDLQEAASRWHPGLLKYRAPAETALPVGFDDGFRQAKGWDLMEEQLQAEQMDIIYKLTVSARREDHALIMRRFVASIYMLHGVVRLKDSLGDERLYECFREGISVVKEVGEDKNQRTCSFVFNLRVEAELDEAPSTLHKTVTHNPETRSDQL